LHPYSKIISGRRCFVNVQPVREMGPDGFDYSAETAKAVSTSE